MLQVWDEYKIYLKNNTSLWNVVQQIYKSLQNENTQAKYVYLQFVLDNNWVNVLSHLWFERKGKAISVD